MSFGKSSTSGSQNSQQQQQQAQSETQGQSQTATPNNLPSLQQGWNAASSLLTGNPTLDAALGLTSNSAAATAAASGAALPALTALGTNGGTTNPANTYLAPIANGSQLNPQSNPYFQNMANQFSQAAQQATDGTMAASGRYGSGANANAFNGAVANETGQLGYAAYNQGLNNQLAAATQLSGNNSNSVNQALTALGLVPSVGAAGTSAGSALSTAAAFPASAYASILSLLGAGGGTQNNVGVDTGTGTTSGTASGSSNSTTSGFAIAPKFSFGPLSFGG